MKKKQSKKDELEKNKYLELAELVSELGDAVGRYYPEDLIARARTIITPLMFENESDYKYFISKIDEFFQEYSIMLQESKFARITGNMVNGSSQQKTLNIIEDLIQKYPEQFNSFVLAHVSIERDAPYIINASMRFLKGKKAYVERFTQDENGYKYIEISSTDEMDVDFLSQDYYKRNDIGDGLRRLSKEELSFINKVETLSALEILAAQDFIYCAKNPRYASALFYNLASYQDFATDKTGSETEKSIVTLMKSNIQYLNLTKLKMIMLCRTMLFAERLGITIENSDTEYAERLVKELLELLKSSKGTKINSDGISIYTIDWRALDFDSREQRKENTIRDNKPLCVFRPHSMISRMKVKAELNLDITTRDVIASAERFLEKREINRFLEKIEHDYAQISEFDFDLKNSETVKSLRTMIYTRIKDEASDMDADEIENLCFQYAKNLIKGLYTYKKANIFELRRFDESAVCELISEGIIEVSNFDLFKHGFSKQAIAFLCSVQPERIASCLEKNYITKDELLNTLHIPVGVIINLFNQNQLSIKEILDLVAQNKITVEQLLECDFNRELLSEQMDASFLVGLYMDILKKQLDYEAKVKEHIENYINQGVSENDIPVMEGELQLQNGIQLLRTQKKVYLNLFELSRSKDKTKTEFLKEACLEALSNMEFQDFCRMVGEMYQDELIDMEFIRLLDSSIIAELIKSFVITSEDIEKFKDTAITDEEIEVLRELCENEDEYQEEFEKLKYDKLKEIIDAIIEDFNITQEEKLGIIYNVLSSTTENEDILIRYYQNAILTGEFITKFEKIKEIYGKNPKNKTIKRPKPDTDKTSPVEGNKFVYPEIVIWNFMRLLDPKVGIKVFKDGNVTFCSKKLEKAVIESIWNGCEGGVKRTYGVATISMNLTTFNNNISQIVVPSRKGYIIDTVVAKSILPTVQTKKGNKKLGLIRHDKDLEHTGKKIWFELLLDDFGINLEDIRQGKDSRYAPEDAEKIAQFIEMAKNSHERI